MTPLDVIASPLFAFLLSLVVAYSTYLLGKRIAPELVKTVNKVAPYACGEYFPPKRLPVRIIFFKYAALFMVFDVVSLVIAFSMGVPPAHPYRRTIITLTGLYCAVLLAALFTLIKRG